MWSHFGVWSLSFGRKGSEQVQLCGQGWDLRQHAGGWNSGVQETEGLVIGYRGTGFQAHGDKECLQGPHPSLFLGTVLFSLGPGALVSFRS